MSKNNKDDPKKNKINDLFNNEEKSDQLKNQIINEEQIDATYSIKKPIKSEVSRNDRSLNTTIRSRIIELRIKGESRSDIQKIIEREYNIKEKYVVNSQITTALDEIKKRSSEISELILAQHLERYDQLYKWFSENGFVKHAQKAMQYRERLIGLHSQQKEIEFNNIYLGQEEGQIANDLDKLDSGEVQKLRSLILKCQVREIIIKDKED